ncbi:beta-N-acetylhexosaminidase [Microbacterium sp. Au-Mic1]|uniref:beta-N-acetylhexosaminidase n=1 Tax=Microbacterium sp. Au-Mic1 TaxID=2906457 RepID=UPI001E442AF3|nr:beta-N-acetylhexosaminidase [Microbacterium sp. Au-Mic1]MCE4027919.1 beta-N-acetylhexosaminidase [Microbacterium sp. Au-Mic1]
MVLHDAPSLIPFPSSVQLGEGSVPLGSAHLAGDPDAIALLRPELEGVLGSDALTNAGTTEIVLEIDPALGSAEGYTLTAGADRIRVTGHDAAGLFYGTRTLLQLLRRGERGWSVPEVRIEDAPRFRYRGVMLDVARHFFGVADVERWIDRAVALKYNHLHLHLTDDQGWRIHIDAWPQLTGAGSGGDATGGPGGFYTKDDIREIVSYAAARHMTIVPEIDLPGHTHAVGLGYPDLVEEPAITEANIAEAAALGQPLPAHGVHYAAWGVGHSSVKIHEERTYDLIRDVLAEVAELMPGPYLHIGGDECLGTSAADFALFFERAGRLAAATGKTPVAWHEAGAVDGLVPGMIGQYWGSVVPEDGHAAHARRFVERGGALILSPSDRAYLDMKPRADHPRGLAWAGIVPLRDAYDWDPAAVLDEVPAASILGIEAPLWTESVTTLAEADGLAFPRIAAHAEIGWSAQNGSERTWESFRGRVAQLVPAWEASGIAVDRAALDDENTPEPAVGPGTAPSIEETA